MMLGSEAFAHYLETTAAMQSESSFPLSCSNSLFGLSGLSGLSGFIGFIGLVG
jgi:hypothetical protein